jgi:hypothetical protein
MCPFCLATLALVAASTTSVGGVVVLAVKLSHKKTTDSVSNSNRSNENADDLGKA